MSIVEDLKNKNAKISLIGLGYVGMPIAVAFAKKVDVIGFDINIEKIHLYQKGIDPTKEVGDEVIKNTSVDFTSDETRLSEAKFHIVAVPTPVSEDRTPNLKPLKSASATLGKNLTKGSIVVFESTVYPGVTEEICVPILEQESGLKCGKDFKVGYSPERINPGDKKHRLENIVKVVSGQDEEVVNLIAKVYELVVDAGVYKAKSIQVAEAAKVIENAQRDINIAFMNELSIIFNKMNIDTKAVLEAAGTKWNFLNFSPGLVGGHCIGVDPYYLTYKAEQEGYHSKIILSGREINDGMGKYIAENTIKKMIHANKKIKGSKVVVLGVTFKENTSDVRNTKVIDVINELSEYGLDVKVVDPIADSDDLQNVYGVSVTDINSVKDVDAVIIAVPHNEFKKLSPKQIQNMYTPNNEEKVLIDIKGMLDKERIKDLGFSYWRL